MSNSSPLVRLPVELHLLIGTLTTSAQSFEPVALYQSLLPSLKHIAFTDYRHIGEFSQFGQKSALFWTCDESTRFENACTRVSLQLKKYLFRPSFLRAVAVVTAKNGNIPMIS